MFVKGNLAALQSASDIYGKAMQEEKNKVIKGWEGKLKGCYKSFGSEASKTEKNEKKRLTRTTQSKTTLTSLATTDLRQA